MALQERYQTRSNRRRDENYGGLKLYQNCKRKGFSVVLFAAFEGVKVLWDTHAFEEHRSIQLPTDEASC